MIYEPNYKRIHEEAWRELAQLSNETDTAAFWARYAKYLRDSEVYSGQRMLLLKMVLRTVEELKS